MSRIGKHPVSVPKGVQVALAGQTLTVSGKLGQLEHTLPGDVQVAENDGTIVVQPRGDSKRARAMWGLSRTLVANMVEGVSTGFTRKLLISGVGFRAAIDGKVLNLQLGYSHVGQIAAELRSFRLPEPYKGKGIRYDDEVIRRKEGKKK